MKGTGEARGGGLFHRRLDGLRFMMILGTNRDTQTVEEQHSQSHGNSLKMREGERLGTHRGGDDHLKITGKMGANPQMHS